MRRRRWWWWWRGRRRRRRKQGAGGLGDGDESARRRALTFLSFFFFFFFFFFPRRRSLDSALVEDTCVWGGGPGGQASHSSFDSGFCCFAVVSVSVAVVDNFAAAFAVSSPAPPTLPLPHRGAGRLHAQRGDWRLRRRRRQEHPGSGLVWEGRPLPAANDALSLRSPRAFVFFFFFFFFFHRRPPGAAPGARRDQRLARGGGHGGGCRLGKLLLQLSLSRCCLERFFRGRALSRRRGGARRLGLSHLPRPSPSGEQEDRKERVRCPYYPPPGGVALAARRPHRRRRGLGGGRSRRGRGRERGRPPPLVLLPFVVVVVLFFPVSDHHRGHGRAGIDDDALARPQRLPQPHGCREVRGRGSGGGSCLGRGGRAEEGGGVVGGAAVVVGGTVDFVLFSFSFRFRRHLRRRRRLHQGRR